MKRILSLIILFLHLSFFVASPVYSQATGDFENSLQTTYTVGDDGTTTVMHQFGIKNLKPTVYMTEYSLTTNFPQLENVVARSGSQEIAPTVSQNDSKTIIQVVFEDQVVGQGKTRQFTIEYTVPRMAVVAGQVLEVQLPPLVSPDPYASHTITLKTPLRFGRAIRVKPEPLNVSVQDQQIVTLFDQSNPVPISAFYGDRQIYTMTLRYNLENNSTSPGLVQVALPPDTSFQRVHYHSLEPPASELKRDEDGNWLATYELPPNTAQTVYLQTDVLVTLDPLTQVPVITPQAAHTAEKKFWETGSGSIKSALKDQSSLKDLYDFTVDSLNYSYDTVQENSINRRLGAVEALRNPDQAVCQEFTDLFITLARAQGTPARRLTGFAYTQNPSLRPLSLESDILHAWPEYYDYEKNIWQPVDPTWESTTGGVDYFEQFDLNHVVFAINGNSSTTPYPAGSYKGTDLSTKDVESSFATSFPAIEPEIEVLPQPVTVFGLPIPGKYTFLIVNKTGQAWYNVKINFPEQAGYYLDKSEIIVPTLLPFQTIPQSVTVTADNWTPNQGAEIGYTFTALEQQTYNGQPISITSGPSFIQHASRQNLLIGVGGISAIGILGTGGVLVFRQRRKRSVRR